jgi:hypothetical protein
VAKELRVTVVGDTKQYAAALKGAAGATSSFGSTLKGIGKTAALVTGAAGIGGLALTLKVGISEWEESTKVAAQTAAVLKSTGGVANVTAKHISDLAGEILRKTGIDDEAIQSGENLIATFTNIRNEAGKGNDIFDQTTRIMADMSTALGEDTKSAAIQLGKALNDPIRGVTTLQRVGVSFTAEQRKQIKALVDSGKSMQAQKLILRELNKEFGGSAEAVGKTLPGQLKILREEFNNVAGEIVGGMIPALAAVASWTSAHWGQISATIKGTFDVLRTAIGGVASFVSQHGQAFAAIAAGAAGAAVAITAISAALKGAAAAQLLFNLAAEVNPYVAIGTAVVAAAAALAYFYETNQRVHEIVDDAWKGIRGTFDTVLPYLQGLWGAFGGAITAQTQAVFEFLKAYIGGSLKVLQGIVEVFLGLIHGDWQQAWDGIKEIFQGVWQSISGILTFAVASLRNIVTAGLDALKALWTVEWNAIKAVAQGVWNAISSAFSGLFGTLTGLATAGGHAVMSGLLGGLRAGWQAVTGWLTDVPGFFRSFFGGAGKWLVAAGEAVMQGFWDGLKKVWGEITGWLSGLGGVITSLKGPPAKDYQLLQPAGRAVMAGFRKGLEEGWRDTASFLSSISPAISGGTTGSVGFRVAAAAASTSGVAPLSLPASSRSAGSTVVNVTVQGALMGSSVPEVAETIRSHLRRYGKNNGTDPLAF